MPSQKNAVSAETTGRSTSPAVPAAVPAGAVGRNFSTRNRIDATASAPAYQVLRVVTNQPSPSAVRFGPVTPSRLERTVSCSPGRRYR